MINLQMFATESIDFSKIINEIDNFAKENGGDELASGNYIAEDVFATLINKIEPTLQAPTEKSVSVLGLTIPITKAEAMAMIISKAAEISTTKSTWVKYRNGLEIGLLIWKYPSLA